MGQLVVVPFNQALINDYGWQAGFMVMAILLAALVPMAAALTGNAETGLNVDTGWSEERRFQGWRPRRGGSGSPIPWRLPAADRGIFRLRFPDHVHHRPIS